jgi:hypothetical protein
VLAYYYFWASLAKLKIIVFFVWSYDPVLNFNWSIVVCLVIDYTEFGGSFYIKINKKPW